MYCSRFASVLVCTALLWPCRPFQISSALKRLSPQSRRNMRRTYYGRDRDAAASLAQLTSRQLTGACNAGSEGADEGDKGGDDIDYSADPLTGFLGKFLPSGDKRKPAPQAKDLVSLVHNNSSATNKVVEVTPHIIPAFKHSNTAAGDQSHDTYIHTYKLDVSKKYVWVCVGASHL